MKPSRNRSLRSAVCLLCCFLAPVAFGLDSITEARAKYDALKAKVQSGDLNIDWRELRLAAVVAEVEGSYDWHKTNTDGVTAYNAGDYKKTLLDAQDIIQHNIANGDGHFLAMVALKRLEKPDEAAKEQQIVDKILQSILSSGDGKTADTAWFTVSTTEEYFTLRLLGLKPKSQNSVTQAGHSFDQITVTNPDGTEAILWFNTDTDAELTRRVSEGP